MSASWLILADDLTGAADSAIAYANAGAAATVVWGEGTCDAAVLAVNVDSRALGPEAAAQAHTAALEKHFRSGMGLYKKIDSTLRGPFAAEIVRTITVLSRLDRGNFGILAPAFPDIGRTTENGSVRVHGVALEETLLWLHEHNYPTANLMEIMADVGLKAKRGGLDVVRQGPQALAAWIAAAIGEGYGLAVFDAMAGSDLDTIAEATVPMVDTVFWIGSGGLAASLASRVSHPRSRMIIPPVSQDGRGILITVGSVAEASRRAANQLVASGAVREMQFHPDELTAAAMPALSGRVAAIRDALVAGENILACISLTENRDLSRGVDLMKNFAAVLAPAASVCGGLIATGGDTAVAMLDHIGINGIRLIDEVEKGIPFGVTTGRRSLPVITKAGAFGSDGTLMHCLDYLHSRKHEGSLS